jgi:type I restriction enzyme S subunit
MVWQKKLLGEVSQIYSGFAFRSQDLGIKGIPVLKIANIQNKLVAPQCADHFPEELLTDRLKRYFLHSDDTLVAMTGAGSVGKVGKMPAVEGKYLVNQRVGIVRPDRSMCDPSFIYYCLSQDFYETKLYALGLGAGQPNVSGKQIAELEILSPPIPVQQRIASILAAYDELIENSQRRIKILEAMARGLYREWFVHFRFPGHENHLRVASALGEIPKGWEVKKLKDVCRLTMGQSPKSEFYNEVGDGVPFHQGVTDFGNRFPTDRLFCTAAGRIAEAGDILFSVRAPVGRMNIANKEIILGRGLSAIRYNEGAQAFLWEQLRNRFTKDDMMGNGAIFASVTKDDMQGIELVCPPLSVVEAATKHFEALHSEIATLSQQIQNLRRTRDLLLPRLLSGQIEVDKLPEGIAA